MGAEKQALTAACSEIYNSSLSLGKMQTARPAGSCRFTGESGPGLFWSGAVGAQSVVFNNAPHSMSLPLSVLPYEQRSLDAGDDRFAADAALAL